MKVALTKRQAELIIISMDAFDDCWDGNKTFAEAKRIATKLRRAIRDAR